MGDIENHLCFIDLYKNGRDPTSRTSEDGYRLNTAIGKLKGSKPYSCNNTTRHLNISGWTDVAVVKLNRRT